MRKVGIFAGSFDPIHNGHLRIAEAARRQAGLDKVFFLVEPRPRHKQGVKALEHRVQMTRLAIKDKPYFGSIVLEQARFTVNDTLPILEARFKGAELHLLMGDEVASRLAAWPHIRELADSVKLLIALRSWSAEDVLRHLEAIKRIKNLNFNYIILSENISPESSSQVRAQLRKNVVPSSLPDDVYTYIKANGLYRSADT